MKRTKSTDAPWTLKELRDAKTRIKELEAERESLVAEIERLRDMYQVHLKAREKAEAEREKLIEKLEEANMIIMLQREQG